MNTKLNLVFFILLVLIQLGASQDSWENELTYEVHIIYPYISISKEKLSKAHTINDFKNETNDHNLHYNPSWIREYISVEISTLYKGEIKKAVSINDTLSLEQKEIMNKADSGTDISVVVKYIPESTLTYNDPKVLYFTIAVNPENRAIYPGGHQALKKYLKEKAIDKIPVPSFQNYDLTAIKFTIGEEGEIINPHVFGAELQTSKKEETDQLLLETIRDMPCWNPAEYADGTKVKQDFVLTVGNIENCMIHLLKIQRD